MSKTTETQESNTISYQEFAICVTALIKKASLYDLGPDYEGIQYIEQNYDDYVNPEGRFPTLDIAIMQTVHEITYMGGE